MSSAAREETALEALWRELALATRRELRETLRTLWSLQAMLEPAERTTVAQRLGELDSERW